jgi:hypothetical protein
VSSSGRVPGKENAGGAPCQECGWRRDEIPPTQVEWGMLDPANPPAEEDLANQYCSGCGRIPLIGWPLSYPLRTVQPVDTPEVTGCCLPEPGLGPGLVGGGGIADG